jgi:predicted Zn-dependent protease
MFKIFTLNCTRWILILTAACFFMQPVQVSGQNFTDDDFTVLDTYYLGRAVAANILANYRLYTGNQELVLYLNRICQALVIHSNHPPPLRGYSVMILDSDEFNAFASPAGHIFITRKLIEIATSEDMLAAVIAHELAHVMLRHSVAIINESRLVEEMNLIAGRAAAIAGAQSAAAARAANFRNSISTSIDTLMRNGYSQTQEFEADLEAIVLLSRAGYDPRALIDLLGILQRSQGNQTTGFFSTHPMPVMRIAQLERLNFRPVNTMHHRTTRFRSIMPQSTTSP